MKKPLNDDEISSSPEEDNDGSLSQQESSSSDDSSSQSNVETQRRGDGNGTSSSTSSGEDDEEMTEVEGSTNESDESSGAEDEPKSKQTSTSLSKSWTALTTHSPCYTGGTVAFSHSLSTASPASINEQNHFILAQRGGDVAIIEAATGLLLRTVRKGKLFLGSNDMSADYDENEEYEDDEDMFDAEAITAFALSPNNVDMIGVTRSHLVRRYSLDNPAVSNGDPAKVTFSFGKSGHNLPVTCIAYHQSGSFFGTGSVDGIVKVWDVRNGYATHALYPTLSDGSSGRGRYAVTCIEWRPTITSLILAIGREDGSISIHDLLLNADDTKKASMPVAVMRDHLSAVTCVAWSSEAGMNSNIAVQESSRARRHGGGVFFSSGRDSVINTWLISEEGTKEPDSPKRKKKKENGRRGVSVKVAYQRIRTLPVYEQVESMVLLPRHFHPASKTKVQLGVLDKKDIVLATCGTKGVVRLWKGTPGDKDSGIQTVLSELSPLLAEKEDKAFGYTSLHLTNISAPHLSPTLVAVDAEHNMTFLKTLWSDGGEGSSLEFITDRAIVGHNGEILDLSVIPQLADSGEDNDHHKVAIATNSSQVRIFGLEKTEDDEIGETRSPALSPRGLLDGHTAIVLSIDSSPCGRFLATASKDKTMRLWHLSTQKCVAVATGHTEAIGSVALSRKIGCYDVGGKAADSGAGAFVVTASKDRTLKVWNLPGSAVLNQWAEGNVSNALNARLSAQAHEKDINIVTVAPNDSLIATGSQDKQVKLWRTDLAPHGTLKGHKRGVWDVQFAPHDRLIVTASGDRTLKLWSLVDCKCLRTFQGHVQGVLRVRFLNSGLQLLSCGSDGLLKLWTIRTNECESTIDGHDDKVWALDLSPCGKALFSGGADSKIVVWRDTTKEREDAVRDAEEQTILMEQKLSNHLRHKQYEQALELALELEKPHQVLKVMTDIVEKDAKTKKGIETLQKHVVGWSIDRLTQILKYCREWNTRARNSHIAMLVVKAVVTTIPVAKLASHEGLPEIIAGITPYAERHFDRLDRLVGSSYLLDHTLFSMGSLHGSSNENFNDWLEKSKYVLPPTEVEGKVQVEGRLVVHSKTKKEEDSSDEDEVMTIGESDSDDDGSTSISSSSG